MTGAAYAALCPTGLLASPGVMTDFSDKKVTSSRVFINRERKCSAAIRWVGGFLGVIFFLCLCIVPESAGAPFSFAPWGQGKAVLWLPPPLADQKNSDIFRSVDFLGVPGAFFFPKVEARGEEIPAVWQSLAQKLRDDGFEPAYIADIFCRLGDCYSSVPMGNKILELYRLKLRRGPLKEDPDENGQPAGGKATLSGISPGVLTVANMDSARKFMAEHEAALKNMQEAYGVDPEVATAILLVETGFGAFLGSGPALNTLAGMAACRDPQEMRPYLKDYAFNAATEAWLADIMPRRADWAYSELKALLAYGRQHNLNILTLPGSVYGAVGLCQFMPSNIEAYGVDATGKGWVDLFSIPDALASLGNYLKMHGWRADLSEQKKYEIVLRYNKSRRYANTIITVADYLKTPPGTPLPVKAFQPAVFKYTPPKTPVKPHPPQSSGRYYGTVPLQ